MGSDPGRRINWRLSAIALALFLGGFGFALGGHVALEKTNSVEFCTSCHSMALPYDEYQGSLHFKNRFGTAASCSDCHVPRALMPLLNAKLMAARDVMHEILGTIDTPEKFEAHRWRMANRVWDKMISTDSRECRECHKFDQMDLEKQERRTARKHEQAEVEGETCIVCHKGIAHRLPDPPPD